MSLYCVYSIDVCTEYEKVILIVCTLQDLDETPFAQFVYDAVWTYAKALDRVLRTHPGALEDIHSNENTKYILYYHIMQLHDLFSFKHNLLPLQVLFCHYFLINEINEEILAGLVRVNCIFLL